MTTAILGIFLVALGIASNIWVSRRIFYRRNMAGIEQFDSYGKALATRFQEKIVLLIAGLCILSGITCLVASCINRMGNIA